MANFLIKSGTLLMSIAGIFIVSGFFIFVFFSLILIMPGLLLYNAGIKMGFEGIFNNANDNIFDENGMKVISSSAPNKNNDFVNKAKTVMKSVIKKIRDFLNKYAD